MRPLTLSIEGLRSFRTPVEIDFDGRDHVAVTGDTGAGKSSILEAITYALYGKTSFSAQGNQELMNDSAKQLRVVLRFRVSAEVWEVARALRRDGQGDVQSAGATLQRLDDEGEAVQRVEKVRPVNDRIERLIGMDSEAFLRTVILPQGRFARLLVEDKPRERSDILRQVWRTDDLEEMGGRAAEAHSRVERLRDRLKAASDGYPDDPDRRLAELNQLRDMAEKDVDRAAAIAEEAGAALRNLQSAEDRRRVASEWRRSLSGVRIDDLDGKVRAAAEAMNEWRTQREKVSAAREKADAARRAERKAMDSLVGRSRQSGELEKQARVAQEKLSAVERGIGEIKRIEGEVKRGSDRVEECATELDRLSTGLEEAERAKESADAELAAARRRNSAAAAARDLHAGDECPVCLRDLPPGWSSPGQTDLDAAEKSARSAGDLVSRHTGQRLLAEQQLVQAEEGVRTAEAELGRAEKELAQSAGVPGDAPLPEPPELLRPFSEQLRRASDELARHDRDTKKLSEQAKQRRAEADELEAAANRADKAAERQKAAVQGGLKAIGRDYAECRDAVRDTIRALALDTVAPPTLAVGAADLLAEAGALEARIADLRETTGNVVRAADERVAREAAEAEKFRSAIAEIARRLGMRFGAGAEEGVAKGAAAKAERARAHALAAKNEAASFAAIVDDVKKLRGILDETSELALALGDLARALKPGSFPKWLTLRRSRALLALASRTLGEITGGKYYFADPGREGDQWYVLDKESGQPRTPASLSGGEQFIASLSLALGMVEMMARSGGRIESLFLDEGFGSLDRNNLDAAVEALASVAARGRMVWVISHVRAVAEQIEDVLTVTRSPTGSRARWLTVEDREEFALSGAGGEASAALAGLLE